MKIQKGAFASKGSACPKKAAELFFVVHQKVPKPLLGPFLTASDAECGRVVTRSAGATVEARAASQIDDITRWHAVNNGQVCRTFAGVSHD